LTELNLLKTRKINNYRVNYRATRHNTTHHSVAQRSAMQCNATPRNSAAWLVFIVLADTVAGDLTLDAVGDGLRCKWWLLPISFSLYLYLIFYKYV
jgi:hypothetical protein